MVEQEINACQEKIDKDTGRYEIEKHKRDALVSILQKIAELEPVWIPVSEKLPPENEYDEYYLVASDN
jgi:predicted DNA-binding ArsR family transcriptional regulator